MKKHVSFARGVYKLVFMHYGYCISDKRLHKIR